MIFAGCGGDDNGDPISVNTSPPRIGDLPTVEGENVAGLEEGGLFEAIGLLTSVAEVFENMDFDIDGLLFDLIGSIESDFIPDGMAVSGVFDRINLLDVATLNGFFNATIKGQGEFEEIGDFEEISIPRAKASLDIDLSEGGFVLSGRAVLDVSSFFFREELVAIEEYDYIYRQILRANGNVGVALSVSDGEYGMRIILNARVNNLRIDVRDDELDEDALMGNILNSITITLDVYEGNSNTRLFRLDRDALLDLIEGDLPIPSAINQLQQSRLRSLNFN